MSARSRPLASGGKRRRRAMVAMVASVVVWMAAGCTTGDQTGTQVGAAAPAYAAVNLDGAPTSLTALRGKVVILNEWATWCGPCREEMPRLEALHQQYASRGLVVVGVSIDAFGTGSDVRDFARDRGMRYPIWLDPDKHMEIAFHTVGVPTTLLIDRRGVIRWRGAGALVPGDTTLEIAVRRALAP